MMHNSSLKSAMASLRSEDLLCGRKDTQVNIRLSSADKAALVDSARTCGLTFSEFMLQSALYAAEMLRARRT